MKKSQHAQSKEWHQLKRHTPEKLALARLALEDIRNGVDVFEAIKLHPLEGKKGGYIGKQMLVAVYRQLVEDGEWEPDPAILVQIRMKPMRTQSGVTVVTVLTKPYPCPGKCIFCPDDVRMPKSYLPDEPGAMRALHHEFDPYDQVTARIEALEAVGHPTHKIELLVLGGTWSAYPKDYQEWFIHRLFDAMNGIELPTLEEAQRFNQTAEHRNVGLAIETRPDHVISTELAWLRRLGATKVQMGAQSFADHILDINKRGHNVRATLEATALLRAAGFKIVLHWMPNLYGATLESDREDFARMWVEACPDEIKIYPNQLLKDTELYGVWQQGEYQPYTTEELITLIADIKPSIPRYCRVNRVLRDIPSTHVVDGNTRTSLRMDIHDELERRGTVCSCIRCREVRGSKVDVHTVRFNDLTYQAGGAVEHFLSYVTPEDKVAGFLRLSLPGDDSPRTSMNEIDGAAIIREVHVYGQSLGVGDTKEGAAQHIGLGTRLIKKAEQIGRELGYSKLVVISAVGTREYYARRDFALGELYMSKNLRIS
jgi:elongator complex protein 3